MRSDTHSFVRRILALAMLSSLALVPVTGCENIEVESRTDTLVPLLGIPEDGTPDPEVIPNQYLIALPKGSSSVNRERLESDVRTMGGTILQSYDSDVRQGFAAYLAPNVLADVRKKSGVAWIEANRYGARTGIQTCPSWNLDMLDHQSNPGDPPIEPGPLGTMKDHVYAYGDTSVPVYVLVLDTGIEENQFPKAQIATKDASGNEFFTTCHKDTYGHGTMVATVVADKTLGVAKKATLIPFNIECSDATAPNHCKPSCPAACPGAEPEYQVDIKAIEAVDKAMDKLPKPLVILYPRSFHIDYVDSLLHDHVQHIIEKGGIFVTASGRGASDANGKYVTDACKFAPAKFAAPPTDPLIASRVITAGALTPDGDVGLANSGSCVDFFAPGAEIPTQLPAGACGCMGAAPCAANGTGSSFAAAHAAGVAAMLLGMGVDVSQVKQTMLDDRRFMQVKGGLPGSPDFVLHERYNVGISGVTDVDGNLDKVQSCNDPGCVMCNGANETNVCNQQSPPNTCTARVQCTGSECGRCGTPGDPCCQIGVECDDGVQCNNNGLCACGNENEVCCNAPGVDACGPNLACVNQQCFLCGDIGQPCCTDGANPPCNSPTATCASNGKCVDQCVSTCCDGTEIVLGNLDDATCKRQGGDACWDREGPQVVHNQGASVWAALQCPSLQDTYAVCCDGTEMPLNPQYSVDVAKEVAIAACVQGVPSKMQSLYMNGKGVASVFPDTCGKCDVLCCDGTSIGGDFAWPGTDPRNACKLFGGNLCKDHGYGPSRISYLKDAAQNPYDYEIIWSKGTDECPTNYPCIATCSDLTTVFVGDMFDEGLCNLMAQNTNACPLPLQLVDAHLVKGCGGAGQDCCPDGSCSGDMVCDTTSAVPTCRGSCSVRCSKGQAVRYQVDGFAGDLPTKEACEYWAGRTCSVDHNWGVTARLRYNHKYIVNLDDTFPGACGDANNYCCMGADQFDGTDTGTLCDDPGAHCISWTPDAPAAVWQTCSSCGGNNQSCCTSGQKCGIGLGCTNGKCQ